MNNLTSLATRLQAALDAVEAGQGALQAELDGAQQRLAQAETDLTDLRSAAESETGALAAAQEAADQAGARALAAESALSEAQDATDKAVERAEAAETTLAEAEARIASLEADLSAAADESALQEAEARIEALSAELEEAKADTAAAQSEVASLSETHQATQAELADVSEHLTTLRNGDAMMAQKARGESETLVAQLTRAEVAVSELLRVNAQLRTNNAALRGALETGLSDPKLVDAGLKTELAALRAARDADRAELDSVLEALAPALKEVGNA